MSADTSSHQSERQVHPAAPVSPPARHDDGSNGEPLRPDELRHNLKNTLFSLTIQCACAEQHLQDGELHEVHECLDRIKHVANRLRQILDEDPLTEPMNERSRPKPP